MQADGSCSLTDRLNTIINWIPGIKSIQLKDLPSVLQTTDSNNPMLQFVITEAERCLNASAIIFNSYHTLEPDVLGALASFCPPIYAIGPLQLRINQLPQSRLKSLGLNLWTEDADCVKWLDTKEANSVIYVSYGSITFMTPR